MPVAVYFSLPSICAFIALGVIRGTFSVAIYFADKSYKSPSLVFLLRTPGTIVLYIFTAIFLAVRDKETRYIFVHNIKNAQNYLKSAIMGFVQLTAPYLMFMYGLKILSPTAGGVYMAAAPWFATILERFSCIQHKPRLTSVKILALFIGFGGVSLVSAADFLLALNSDGECHFVKNETLLHNSTNSSQSRKTIPATLILAKQCTKFTEQQVGLSLLALIGGSLMWAMSSVFWRSKRGDIHYIIAGVWNNTYAGLYALAFWFASGSYKNDFHLLEKDEEFKLKGILSIIFLTMFSGWIAALIVNYMYKNVGPAATNRVLCLVPLFTWIEDWIFVREFKQIDNTVLVALEVIGLVITFSGLITSSLEMENYHSSLQAPLLPPSSVANDEDHGPFSESYRQFDDGATSEEEIDTGRMPTASPFPPLVEIKPEI